MERQRIVADAIAPLARAAGLLASYCDQVEHNEAADRAPVVESGATLRSEAMRIFSALSLDAADSYLDGLARGEARYAFSSGQSSSVVRPPKPTTWRRLQEVQARHDAVYHPDGLGLSKREQLRHYTFHVAKLAWLTQEAASDDHVADDYVCHHLPDLQLFGIKLATVVGVALPDDAFLAFR